MTLERRMQALLDLVEGDCSAQCETILSEARARAAALVAEARAEAHTRIREVFTEERRRARDRIAAAHAKLNTRLRLHDQQRPAALLELGWRRLPDALRGRWLDEPMRGTWIDAVVTASSRALPHAQWRIAHEPEWPPEEQQAVGRRIAAEVGVAPVFVADAGIVAGLRISATGNVCDGTQGGLLADRAEVGAHLLRHLEHVS